MLDVKNTVNFARKCLKDQGYSRELIAYLFSTYDLNSFISSTKLNKLELANHFLAHARKINDATLSF
jgi:hypothetical protein